MNQSRGHKSGAHICDLKWYGLRILLLSFSVPNTLVDLSFRQYVFRRRGIGAVPQQSKIQTDTAILWVAKPTDTGNQVVTFRNLPCGSMYEYGQILQGV